ncbi:transcriptional regulator GlxA family with amidase domain [Pelomonas saccharophila]|uniref:Transcriptional regulator GlxA family with amidase domain n=1 Tax=Roseateles saccharophilus TaxID=304 RepID=A0ABU1YM48_ROSSA|nr:helix-turn-helix domain-containing protein [Roseateles saccharophilus]MDR7269300.1 transcriptional regulator GlxA family with amidase domain [Roseateles saccharophilus]
MTPPVRRIGLLLEPGFPLLALAAVVDSLEAVNELQDEARYRSEALSTSGGLVTAQGGVGVQTGSAMHPADWHAVFVIAADPTPPDANALALLRRWATDGVALGGLAAGAAWLASAGLLDGQRACADWPLLDGLADAHAGVAWAQGLWDINAAGDRLSAAGTAGMDLCCAWLAAQHGERLGQEVLQALGLTGLRPRDERQRGGYSEQRGAGSPKLAEALALMEANLGEPLPTEEVATLVGVSRRQLERLFKQHLDTLPSRHYLELRLARARRLLQQSSQSILQIGLSCGFSSGPHFSNAYRAHFGRTPRDERSQRAQAWRAEPSSGDRP